MYLFLPSTGYLRLYVYHWMS